MRGADMRAHAVERLDINRAESLPQAGDGAGIVGGVAPR